MADQRFPQALHTLQAEDDAVEALLRDLVGIPSPSAHEAEAVGALVDWMTAYGAAQAFIDDAGNAIGVFGSTDPAARQIVLLGHIDTFGAALPVYLEGRILHGRGAVDAKGSLCAFAAAAARAALPPETSLIVIGAVEEEAPTSNGARFAAGQYRPALCLIGEPSNWDRITLGYKGRLLLEWRWQGDLGHSAGQTDTAAEHAFAFWEQVRAAVDQHNAGRDKVFARLDSALQAINTGSDGVRGWAEMTIGFRLPPNIHPAALADEMKSLAQASAGGGTLRTFGMEHACVAEKDTPLTRALRGAIRDEGGSPAFVHKTGTSDMNIVGRVWGCPIAAYGPGDSALDHTPQERIDLDEYLRAVRVLTRALERL
ncbi:MAG: [LysW]-lysine hydrolase [Anaerolineae bacterium]|nr:[LysW]-lysine hydrolase [Anaerolineae bacterium]NUQ05429.1 [LysW]-lysine hydrolase [Anaerolineae bacterium]